MVLNPTTANNHYTKTNLILEKRKIVHLTLNEKKGEIEAPSKGE